MRLGKEGRINRNCTVANRVSARATGTSRVLATDLDGTFAGGTASDRARLQRALSGCPDAILVYATGRTVAAARSLMEEAGLPSPDVLIADVGTAVVHGPAFAPVTDLEAVLGRDWPGAAPVRARLRTVESVVEQEVRSPRRVSYRLVEGSLERALDRARDALDGLAVHVIGSADRYIDVLPTGVDKGTTLRRVLQWLGVDEAGVVVAGDTLNDLALFEAGFRGIVVGNGEPALRERVGARDLVYLAAGHGAAGVLEGLVRYGWLRDGTDAE